LILIHWTTRIRKNNGLGLFSFVQGADTQLGLIENYTSRSDYTASWDKEIDLCKDSIQRINKMNPKPRFYVICGDMLDAFPYEGTQRGFRERQLVDFTEIFKELDPAVKLVCVCGNHDVGDVPSQDSIDLYRKQFGSDFFSFWVGGVKFVVLNSQHFKCPNAVPEEVSKQTKFLDELLALSKSEPKPKHMVVFQHIPFFLRDPEEEDDGYYNIDKETRVQLLEKLRHIGVRYIFCGHYHGNAGGVYKDVEEIVTSAIGAPLRNDPSGFRIVTVSEEEITHEFVPFFETLEIEKEKLKIMF